MKVLCISRKYFNALETFTDIEHAKLLERALVDNKEDISLGYEFPQLIPSIVIFCKGKVLSYIRKGKETRLHNSKSILIGGHVDEEDVIKASSFGLYKDIYQQAVLLAANRELKEEVGIDTYIKPTQFKKFLDIQTNDVSKVHIGVVFHIEIADFNLVKPSEEIPSFEWVNPQDVIGNNEYEDWSAKVLS